MYGTVEDSTEDEDAFFAEFESMFFGGKKGGDDFFDNFDEFTSFLESDTKFMRKMFRDLGKDARVAPGKRRKNRKGQNPMMDDMGFGLGASDMEAMMTMMMMPEIFMKGPPGRKAKGGKAKAKKKRSDDGWDTEEEEIDAEDGVVKQKKEDDGWETVSEDEER